MQSHYETHKGETLKMNIQKLNDCTVHIILKNGVEKVSFLFYISFVLHHMLQIINCIFFNFAGQIPQDIPPHPSSP